MERQSPSRRSEEGGWNAPEIALAVEEEILWFEISVNDVLRVQICGSKSENVREASAIVLVERDEGFLGRGNSHATARMMEER